jgi:hypothetical protein
MAERAARAYLLLQKRKTLVCETTDIVDHGSKDYRPILQGLNVLVETGFVGSWSVNNGGRVWWLTERVK